MSQPPCSLCNFAKHSPVKNFSLASPSHLKYVATLPCKLSLIACFLTLIFYKVVWQHVLGVVGFLITVLLQIY